MFACGQNVGAKAITSVIPTGISTAEKTRLKASNALSSRTRPVAFLTNRFRLLLGGVASARDPVVVTCILLRGGGGYLLPHKHPRCGHAPCHPSQFSISPVLTSTSGIRITSIITVGILLVSLRDVAM